MLVDYGLLAKKKRDDRSEVHEYRLTARGLDTYSYALCLMKWGDDCLAGKEAPPVVLHHRECGARLQPLAICLSCNREVTADDVQIDLGNIAESVREDTSRVRVSSRPELYTAGRPTSVSRTLAVIEDRWGFFIVWLALAGVTRFEHFHSILKIARTTLTARLNHLVEHGVFERIKYQTRPLRHEYQLTGKGKALCPVLLALHDWGLRGLPRSKRQTSVLHRSCGMPLEIGVVCRSCRTVPLPNEVDVKQVRVVPPTPKPAAVGRATAGRRASAKRR